MEKKEDAPGQSRKEESKTKEERNGERRGRKEKESEGEEGRKIKR
jgi:hypothetical protein